MSLQLAYLSCLGKWPQKMFISGHSALVTERLCTRLAGGLLCTTLHTKASAISQAETYYMQHGTDSARLDAWVLPLLVQLHGTVYQTTFRI